MIDENKERKKCAALCDQINKWWAGLGYDPEARPVPASIYSGGKRYMVESNMRYGKPTKKLTRSEYCAAKEPLHAAYGKLDVNRG